MRKIFFGIKYKKYLLTICMPLGIVITKMIPMSTSVMQTKERNFKRKRSNSLYSKNQQNFTSSLSVCLKTFQTQFSRHIDESSFSSIPENIRNFLVPHFRLVQSIDDMFCCMTNLLASNSDLFLSKSLSDRLRNIAENSERDLKNLTDDLINEISLNLNGNSTVFSPNNSKEVIESNNFKMEITRVNEQHHKCNSIEFSDSDIDLQLDEIVDEVCEQKDSSNKKCKRNYDTLHHSTIEEKNAIENLKFDIDGFLIVYVDGSCWSNGKANAKAGFGVWFNENHPLNVSKPVKGIPTNNNAEIQAATEAIRQAKKLGITKLRIHTDSMFLINCMTQWIHKWKRNNWKTVSKENVKNKDSLLELDKVISLMKCVDWKHVEGHNGILGNERADALANEGANQYSS